MALVGLGLAKSGMRLNDAAQEKLEVFLDILFLLAFLFGAFLALESLNGSPFPKTISLQSKLLYREVYAKLKERGPTDEVLVMSIPWKEYAIPTLKAVLDFEPPDAAGKAIIEKECGGSYVDEEFKAVRIDSASVLAEEPWIVDCRSRDGEDFHASLVAFAAQMVVNQCIQTCLSDPENSFARLWDEREFVVVTGMSRNTLRGGYFLANRPFVRPPHFLCLSAKKHGLFVMERGSPWAYQKERPRAVFKYCPVDDPDRSDTRVTRMVVRADSASVHLLMKRQK